MKPCLLLGFLSAVIAISGTFADNATPEAVPAANPGYKSLASLLQAAGEYDEEDLTPVRGFIPDKPHGYRRRHGYQRRRRHQFDFIDDDDDTPIIIVESQGSGGGGRRKHKDLFGYPTRSRGLQNAIKGERNVYVDGTYEVRNEKFRSPFVYLNQRSKDREVLVKRHNKPQTRYIKHVDDANLLVKRPHRPALYYTRHEESPPGVRRPKRRTRRRTRNVVRRHTRYPGSGGWRENEEGAVKADIGEKAAVPANVTFKSYGVPEKASGPIEFGVGL